MFLATSNKYRNLLCIGYVDVVTPEQLTLARPDIESLLAELPSGFRLLANFSQLRSMGVECLKEIGALMEQFDRAGVGMVVRVIPDESKDIGLNILTVFHYPHRPQVVTCSNMTEAARVLKL